MKITGIILSGGKSIRMGQDKGLLEINGKPMIQHVIDHVKPICNQILISANTEDYKRFGYPVIPDVVKDTGPAGGLISCLPQSESRKNIIISCDLPFASTEFIVRLLELSGGYDITIPMTGRFLQSTCGIYDREIRDTLRSLIDEGHYSLRYLVRQFKLNILESEHFPDIDLSLMLRNINNREDIERYVQ